MQTQKHIEFKITPTVKREIVKIIDERIRDAHVTKEDFSELKGIVRDLGISVGELAEAQKRTELKVEELAEAQKRTELKVEELAEAQKRTELKVEELAEAQKRTEAKVEELAEAQKRTEEEIRKLVMGLNNLRGEVGGLARSFGYAFENEAYRILPKALKEKYGVELTEKLIRTEIGDTEINIVGFGRRDGTEVVVVGEVKTRLERMQVFDELEEKVRVVKEQYSGKEIVKVLVTHFATKRILKVAEDSGIIVVQSYDW